MRNHREMFPPIVAPDSSRVDLSRLPQPRINPVTLPLSRSDDVMVAVGLNPRRTFPHTARVAERRLNTGAIHSSAIVPDDNASSVRRYATHPLFIATPWVETHGYLRALTTRGETGFGYPIRPPLQHGTILCLSKRGLFLVLCLLSLLLTFTSFAQPALVLDRIGPNSSSTDGNPGGLIVHYAHGTSNELWGTAGTVWTQPFNGTLAEVALVGFARVVNATNGMYLDAITNLSGFSLSLHLWTNGVAGFLAATNPAHGDLILPLGPGPSAPPRWGVTSVTNRLVNTTNLYISTLPTFRLATNLAAFNVRLQAGREYVLALAFEGADTNVVIRQSTARGSGAADVFAMYATTRGLLCGTTTNAFSLPQFATTIQVQPETAAPTLSIARRDSAVDLWWPETSGTPELWTTTNLADGPWALWPDPLTTNFLTLTNPAGQRFFRLKASGW